MSPHSCNEMILRFTQHALPITFPITEYRHLINANKLPAYVTIYDVVSLYHNNCKFCVHIVNNVGILRSVAKNWSCQLKKRRTSKFNYSNRNFRHGVSVIIFNSMFFILKIYGFATWHVPFDNSKRPMAILITEQNRSLCWFYVPYKLSVIKLLKADLYIVLAKKNELRRMTPFGQKKTIK